MDEPDWTEVFRQATGNTRQEPNAVMRSMSAWDYQWYLAHIQAGFTDQQAMALLMNLHSAQVTAALFNNRDDDEK